MIIFNRKNMYFNVEDWLSGKTKILFIIGSSGSGKSTLSKNLSKKYNVEVIDMDVIWNKMEIEDVNDPYGFEKKCDKITNDLIKKYEIHKNKIIIDGIYPLWLKYPEDLNKFGIILIRKSVLLSSIRAAFRDRNSDWVKELDSKFKLLKWFKDRFKLNMYADTGIKFLLNVIKEKSFE